MPWVVKKSSKCPSYKPWAVINQQSGAKEGCHPSKEAATQQQKALYAKEPQMSSATDCECQQDREGDRAAQPPGEFIRAIPFEMIQHSDGLTLEGYAAVFNSPTRIGGWEGDFEETIAPGAFGRTLRERTPVLMFEHGKHPLIGSMPLGVIQRAEEDTKGVYIEARLSDNWLIQPVRDAVRDGGVTGMSFRFQVPESGDSWLDRKGNVPLRTLLDINVPELGPVVFPQYEPTTAAVRSALDSLSDLTGRSGAWSADGGVPDLRPGKGQRSSQSLSAQQHARDRELRIRGIIRG